MKRALRDLESVLEYKAADDADSAQRVAQTRRSASENLDLFLQRGRHSAEMGTRELVVPGPCSSALQTADCPTDFLVDFSERFRIEGSESGDDAISVQCVELRNPDPACLRQFSFSQIICG